MEQLAVSELQQITVEIKVLKHQTAQNIIEIGKRLKRVKDRLEHGRYLDWLRDEVDFDQSTAAKFVKVSEQFANVATSPSLSTGKLFELIALPESVDRQEFVEQPHMIPSTGESKTVDEMTVRELREVKQALKEAEQRAERAEAERKRTIEQAADIQRTNRELREQNEQLKRQKNPEPQVIEKIVEVEKVPEHVQKQLDEDKFTINALRHSRDELKTRIQTLEMQLPDKFDVEAAELKKKRLQMDADINVLQLVVGVKEFLQRHAITAYASGALAASEPTVKRKLNDVLSQLDDFVRDVQAALNNRIIVEEATYQEAY